MPARKGNLNALRHGLYRKHFTPEITPELKRMPTDSLLSEIAALRLCAARALDLYEFSHTDEDRSRAILTAVHALETAVADLCLAMVDFFENLFEDGLPVPEPTQ
jgi:hypothetical protein